MTDNRNMQLYHDYMSKKYSIKQLSDKHNISRTRIFEILKTMNSEETPYIRVSSKTERNKELVKRFVEGATKQELADSYKITIRAVAKILHLDKIGRAEVNRRYAEKLGAEYDKTDNRNKEIVERHQKYKIRAVDLAKEYKLSKSSIYNILNNAK